MNERDDSIDLSRRILTVQIIAAVLVTGLTVFAAVAIVLVQQQGRGLNPPPGGPTVSWLALGWFVVAVLASVAVPALFARAQLTRIAAGTWTSGPGMPPKTDAGKLLAVYQSRTLIASALLEGAGFFAGIAYLVEGQAFVLGVLAAAILLMLATFPTRLRVERWLEAEQVRVDELRQSGDLPKRS